jgi:hypothetical protein
LMSRIAQTAMENSEHSSVPTSLWVETRIMRAKTYIFNDDVANAINTLKDICYILPPFPIENLQFIEMVLVQGRAGMVEDLQVIDGDDQFDHLTEREKLNEHAPRNENEKELQ